MPLNLDGAPPLPSPSEYANAIAVALARRLGGVVLITPDELREGFEAEAVFFESEDGLRLTVCARGETE